MNDKDDDHDKEGWEDRHAVVTPAVRAVLHPDYTLFQGPWSKKWGC